MSFEQQAPPVRGQVPCSEARRAHDVCEIGPEVGGNGAGVRERHPDFCWTRWRAGVASWQILRSGASELRLGSKELTNARFLMRVLDSRVRYGLVTTYIPTRIAKTLIGTSPVSLIVKGHESNSTWDYSYYLGRYLYGAL